MIILPVQTTNIVKGTKGARVEFLGRNTRKKTFFLGIAQVTPPNVVIEDVL